MMEAFVASTPHTVTNRAEPGAQNVVLWGQNGGGLVENNDLATYCTKSTGIDIVVLSFLDQYGSRNKIASGTIGQSCSIDTSGKGQNCDNPAKAIDTCKTNRVKVIMSLVGAAGAYSLSSEEEAEAIGQNLWQAYGNLNGQKRQRPPPLWKDLCQRLGL
ncbi:hypothetical protein MY11210_008319 [Beauveria gryllotalpidicola]